MLTLAIRTDKPEAEIGLYEGGEQLDYQVWRAHRELSATLHGRITAMLQAQSKQFEDLQAIIVYQGPGSFTGLRIGLTVANAVAFGLQLPIVAAMGESWVETGLERLQAGEDDRIALPHYGADAHITKPKR